MEAPFLRVSNREEDSMNNEPSLSGRSIVGLIIPPPDIRAIVEKTAQFVARNGIEFENKIKEKEALNPRFGFLAPTDPYHAYYRNKVFEFETGAPPPEAVQPRPQLPEAVREHVEQAEFVPTHPPPAFEFMADPATINGFDLDLMRLTALFVARNGRHFMNQLMSREVRNYQFDFLKPQHSNFPYFSKLVEQYTKVIIPPTKIVDDLAKTLDYDLVMGDIKYRVAWEKHQRAIKEREDKAIEQERLAYNSIDWHDFVVVQTVDFQPSETLNLPPMCSRKDVGSRILLQQRSEAAKAANESVAMEMDSDSEEEEPPSNRPMEDNVDDTQRAAYEVTQPAPAAPQLETALVRDYDPKKARQQQPKKPPADRYIISPLTNERISADKLHDHVRYNTVDPQYKEQRDREQLDRQDEDAMLSASGTEISRNIAKMAERRTDIFGVGAQGGEQTAIGKKLGEEERKGPPRPDARNIWDGQQSTIEATTRFAQQQAMQERIAAAAAAATTSAAPVHNPTPAALLQQLVGAPVSLPPGGAAPPPTAPPQPPSGAKSLTLGGTLHNVTPTPSFHGADTLAAAPNPNMYGGNDLQDGPAVKRARIEDQLVPESEWLKNVRGVIQIIVTTPISPEFNISGEPIHLNIDVSAAIGELKAEIQERTTVPISKQKICYEGMYPKDNNSLAFYNLNNGSVVQLQLKERGGRKK